MALSINHNTKVINVPQDYLTPISGSLYELDLNQFRKDLKALEDDSDGIVLVDTHRHNTTVTLSGVTYSRTVEIINGYTVTFTDGQYRVRCVGANHNLSDVMNLNQVSLIVGNAAGLVSFQLTASDKDAIAATTWQKPQALTLGKFLALQ